MEMMKSVSPVDHTPAIKGYDDLVAVSPQSSIYCNRWWLDAVAPGRYQILENWKGGTLFAAWPIVFTENKGCKAYTMPSLAQKLGILFRPQEGKYAEQLSPATRAH